MRRSSNPRISSKEHIKAKSTSLFVFRLVDNVETYIPSWRAISLQDSYTEMNMRSLNKEAAGESVAVDADFVQSCAGAFAGQQARLQEAKEQDILYAYKGIDVTRKTANPSKSVIARQSRRMTDVVYDRLLGYFMARGSQYTPATIRKALDHVMNLKAAADMKADEVFEKARERIEKGGTDRRAHHRMSPMADVNTDNYRMPKIG